MGEEEEDMQQTYNCVASWRGSAKQREKDRIIKCLQHVEDAAVFTTMLYNHVGRKEKEQDMI